MFEATPGVYVVRAYYEGVRGTYEREHPVVAFMEVHDDAAVPLVLEEDGLRCPNDIPGIKNWSLEEIGPLVPAEPGWYAAFVIHGGWGDTVEERCPVVAWRCPPGEYNGGAVVIATDGVDEPAPIDVRAHVRETSNVDLLGYFHPERQAEPDLRQEIARLNEQQCAPRETTA